MTGDNIERTQYKYCIHCGKIITSKRQKYCSDKCSWRYASKKKREELDQATIMAEQIIEEIKKGFKDEFSTDTLA